jgi:uncharacterized protein YjbI with pentapeptide repeats
VNSLPLVYYSQNSPMDEEHLAKRKKSRWWPTSRGAMRIFAALIAVGALLFVFRGYYPENLRGRPLAVLGAATVVVAAVVVLIRVGQHYQWTGFGESVRPKADSQEIQPRKTLWDWLQLFIVPLALAAIGLWFSAQQDSHQQKIEEKRAKSDRHIEEQRAQDAALQAYLDQMSQLMLEGDLLDSKQDSEVRTLARARTLTVLTRLDSRRKGSVVQFLHEASLIKKEGPVVSLSAVRLRGANLSHLDLLEANLSGANLNWADLSGTDLSGADLRNAHLSGANLNWADLSGVEMSGADLSDAHLNYADLTGGADLSGADLSDVHLSDAHLNDADIGDGTILFNADLSGADLSGANLTGGAHLNDAILSGADLSGANLSGANLSGADLRETYLVETNLSDTDLSGANLRDARGVTDKQLLQAKTLEGATMPDGSIHD